jgi:hypothetical protein
VRSIPRRIIKALLPLLIICAHSALSAAEIRWQFEAGGRIIGKPTITENGIYVAGGNTLFALSLDGEELWRRELAGDIAASITVGEERRPCSSGPHRRSSLSHSRTASSSLLVHWPGASSVSIRLAEKVGS